MFESVLVIQASKLLALKRKNVVLSWVHWASPGNWSVFSTDTSTGNLQVWGLRSETCWDPSIWRRSSAPLAILATVCEVTFWLEHVPIPHILLFSQDISLRVAVVGLQKIYQCCKPAHPWFSFCSWMRYVNPNALGENAHPFAHLVAARFSEPLPRKAETQKATQWPWLFCVVFSPCCFANVIKSHLTTFVKLGRGRSIGLACCLSCAEWREWRRHL